MSLYSQSSTRMMLSIKVLLISTSVLSMAVMLKFSMPVITEFTLSELPSVWSFVISWLRPPYLYVVINCIIITIVASSRLQSKVDDHPMLPPETAALLHTEPIKLVPRVEVQPDYAAVYDSIVQKSERPVEVRPEFENDYGANLVEVPEPDLYGTVGARLPDTKSNFTANALEEMRSVNEFMISETVRNMPKKDFIPREKPPVSARFGHRKSIKASSEGGVMMRTLGVAKPKRQDTLESTWKTITEGRPMPLTRHLRKSDTWETQGTRQYSSDHHHHQDHDRMTKSETFNVSNNPPTSLSRSTGSGSGKLKRDPSLGQEELNKRVEAFIKKFNEDMRLQRQESLNQYMEMIKRGAH